MPISSPDRTRACQRPPLVAPSAAVPPRGGEAPLTAKRSSCAGDADTITSPISVSAMAPSAPGVSVSASATHAMITVNKGLLTWKMLARAGPRRAIDSKKNQRPRYVEKAPARA